MTPNLQLEFSRFAGELAETLSFNRSVGQIYGLLYLSSEALSLDEIAKRLLMSKGNASINVRALEAWNAVRPVSVSGSRRDHYEANRDLRDIALKRLQEGLSRRLDMAENRLENLLARFDAGGTEKIDPVLKKHVQDFRALVGKGRKALSVVPKVLRFL